MHQKLIQLHNARWHASEARLKDLAGEREGEDYHREAAQEALEAFTDKRYRFLTVDELDALIAIGFDALVCN